MASGEPPPCCRRRMERAYRVQQCGASPAPLPRHTGHAMPAHENPMRIVMDGCAVG